MVRIDFPFSNDQNTLTVVLGDENNPIDLTGFSAQLRWRKKMATAWTILSPPPVITPPPPGGNSSQIAAVISDAVLDGSNATNFREYEIEVRNNPALDWEPVAQGGFWREQGVVPYPSGSNVSAYGRVSISFGSGPALIDSYGADPTGVSDSRGAFLLAIQTGAKQIRGAGRYRVDGGLQLPATISLEGPSPDGFVIDARFASNANLVDHAVLTTPKATYTLLPAPSTALTRGATQIVFSTPHGLSVEDVICWYNPTDFSYSGHRNSYRAGEFRRVKQIVSTTEVVLDGGLYADYSAGVLVYRVTGMSSVTFRNLTVLAPDIAGVATYGIRLRSAVDSSLDGVKCLGARHTAIGLEFCLGVDLRGCTAGENNILDGTGTDYGLMLANSQHVTVHSCRLTAIRHGFATGGFSEVGAIPVRNVYVELCSISTTGITVAAADTHGNTEYVHFAKNYIDGGLSTAGNKHKIEQNFIRGRTASGGAIYGVLLYELSGTDYIIESNDIECSEQDPDRGIFLDVGGNSNVLSASSRTGGALVFRGNTMRYAGVANSLQNWAKIINRGYAGAEPISIVLENNVLQSNVRIGTANIQVFSGSPFASVKFAGNQVRSASGLRLQHNLGTGIAALDAQVENNAVRGGFDLGFAVFNVRDNLTFKNNTATGNRFGVTLGGSTGTLCRNVDAKINTLLDNLTNATSSSSTNTSIVFQNINRLICQGNTTGSENERLLVASNTGFLIGETVTGLTSGATATVLDTRSTTELMIERTRSGTFVGGETVRGATSLATTTLTSTAFTASFRFRYDTITTLWQGQNMNTRALSDSTNAVGTSNTIT